MDYLVHHCLTTGVTFGIGLECCFERQVVFMYCAIYYYAIHTILFTTYILYTILLYNKLYNTYIYEVHYLPELDVKSNAKTKS